MSVFFKYVLIVLGLSSLANPVMAQTEVITDYVPGEVLVQWKQDYFGIQADQGRMLNTFKSVNPISVLSVDDVTAALQDFEHDPRVAHVEPNYQRHLMLTPDDVEYAYQLHLEQSTDYDIDAEAAWDTTTGDRDIIVAVIDSGVDLDHPDLTDNIWTNPNEIAGNGIDDDANGYIDDVSGWDFIENDNDPNPTPTGLSCDSTCQIYVLHGTHVAGIIGATGDNTTGVTGVNWNVSIMPLRIFDADGNSTTAGELEAIAYAQANGATIINMSYGGYYYSPLEDEAITEANDAGIVSVAAAGNDATNLNLTPSYPVCNDNVIGVGAVDELDITTSFSNYGSSCVDVAAPGENIYSTYYTNDSLHGFTEDYGYLSGTSMATPIVSGLASLLWSADSALTAAEVTSTIIETVDPIVDAELGSGRVNAATAIDFVTSQGPDAVTISAYTNAHQTIALTPDERSSDSTPYFTWTEPTSVETVSGYYVYGGTTKEDPVTAGTLQSSTIFTPVIHGNETTYYVRVKAVDALGQTSEVTEFAYLIDTKVGRPVWQSLERTALGAQLRWYRPAAEHVVGYYVYRSRQRSGRFKKITQRLVAKTSYLDKKPQRGKHYYYKVRAVDNLGNLSTLTVAKKI